MVAPLVKKQHLLILSFDSNGGSSNDIVQRGDGYNDDEFDDDDDDEDDGDDDDDDDNDDDDVDNDDDDDVDDGDKNDDDDDNDGDNDRSLTKNRFKSTYLNSSNIPLSSKYNVESTQSADLHCKNSLYSTTIFGYHTDNGHGLVIRYNRRKNPSAYNDCFKPRVRENICHAVDQRFCFSEDKLKVLSWETKITTLIYSDFRSLASRQWYTTLESLVLHGERRT